MISLVQVVGKLRNVNLRAEIHGDDTVPACDLKIGLTLGGDFLNILEPGLKEFVFKPEAEKIGLLSQLIAHEITLTLTPPLINQADIQVDGSAVKTLDDVFKTEGEEDGQD
jgi:hypothetical protein